MDQNQNLEVERKFLVKTPPEGYQTFKSQQIQQGYLTEPDGATEIRVRKKSNTYLQTIKRGQGLVREEVEIELSLEQFEMLWPLTEGRRLEKMRYVIPYKDVVIELDIYTGNLSPLITAEIEFPSVEASESFIPPEWVEKEVTEELHYGNVNLATKGIPEQFKL